MEHNIQLFIWFSFSLAVLTLSKQNGIAILKGRFEVHRSTITMPEIQKCIYHTIDIKPYISSDTWLLLTRWLWFSITVLQFPAFNLLAKESSRSCLFLKWWLCFYKPKQNWMFPAEQAETASENRWLNITKYAKVWAAAGWLHFFCSTDLGITE